MSSSNLVSVISVDETTYGVTPDPTTGITADTARFTSESLSGTPTTTESAAIRTDRMSGGLVATGLEVGGDLSFELAKDPFFDKFFALGMMSTWTAKRGTHTGQFTPDPADDQKGEIAGSNVADSLVAGDVIVLEETGGAKHLFVVISVTDTDHAVVASKRGQANVTGDIDRPEHLDIGSTVNSVTLAKAYKDVTHLATTDEHSQTYSGSIVSGFNISAEYGQIVNGAFNTVGNGYKQENPSLEQKIVTGGGTVNPAGTSNPLNASIDVPVVATNGASTTFCIESFGITLDNGTTPQNCIGHAAPRKYELGTAAISIDASIFLGDQSYDQFMPSKLSQTPISIVFTMINNDGGYAFALPAVQLSFPDPSAGGANSPVMIDASGTAKVGSSGESALRIYKF